MVVITFSVWSSLSLVLMMLAKLLLLLLLLMLLAAFMMRWLFVTLHSRVAPELALFPSAFT
jgi:hypothetical protein